MLFTITDARGIETSTIHVGRGLVPGLRLADRAGRSKVAILTQPGAQHVAAQCVDAIRATGVEVHIKTLPDRDEAKTWAQVAEAHEWLADMALGRADTVLGVGGGAVTDVAGFVAATWLRGVEADYVATTLLGAVDAAIGGKTGINVSGKNLVGAFWHPREVFIDLDVLDALSEDIKREGWAELYKTALIGDPELFEVLSSQGPSTPLDTAVPAAIAVKALTVSEDFREHGGRAILNFGHTIGHAVEFASGRSHGESVAIGMVAATAVSKVRYGFSTDVASDLETFGLPIAADVPTDRVRELLMLDKKADAAGIRMVLLRAVGDPIVDHVTDAEIEIALQAVGL